MHGRRRLVQLAVYATVFLTASSLLWWISGRTGGGGGGGLRTLVLKVAAPAAVVEVPVAPSSRVSHQHQHRRSSNNSVTPIIHQSWKTRQLPTKRAERWSASWRSCFPDWEWRLWTDEDNLALVREHYAWFLPVYQGHRQPVERADLARYCYLHRLGGIYADLDAICVRNFAHLLKNSELTFGGMDDDGGGGGGSPTLLLHGLVQNSLMASRGPGHPFWLRLLRRIERNYRAGKRGRPEDLTGPNVLMEELRDYAKANATDVAVYPGKYFNPFSWKLNKNPACKDFGRMSDAEEKACVASFPDAYVVQIHTQSWGRGRM